LALVELVELWLDPLLLEVGVILYLGLLLQLVVVVGLAMLFPLRLPGVLVEGVRQMMEQALPHLAERAFLVKVIQVEMVY
jgi:hypothetical protein